MILRVWMHWFWITTPFHKCFLYLALHLISFSCIYHGSMTEAGLLKNETLILQKLNSRNSNDSSQIWGNDSFPAESGFPPVETTSSEPLASGSIYPEESTEAEVGSEGSDSESSEIHLEGFPRRQMKKFTKYSSHLQLKNGKGKVRPKADEEEEEEKKAADKTGLKVSPEGERPIGSEDSAGVNVSSSEEPETGNSLLTGQPVNGTEESAAEEEPETATAEEEERELDSLRNETLVIENKVQESSAKTTVESFLLENRVAAATSSQKNFEVKRSGLNAGSVTGIALGTLVVFCLSGAISFVLYRRRYSNKPQVLHEKCSNLDSSGYIDDTSLRENSEEMYSLDNDSFLNSLEAMTIQNYWTESVKHTKL